MERVSDLRQQRATAFDAFKALAGKVTLTEAEKTEYTVKRQAVLDADAHIERVLETQRLAGEGAQPVAGQGARVPAAPETDAYASEAAAKARGLVTNKGLVVGGMMRMVGRAAEVFQSPEKVAAAIYGESHPVTAAIQRALITSVGASGGFIVPPDYMNEIIELLRPECVVRGSGPRVIPMPRGTMTLPGQSAPATASYSGEVSQIATSQQQLDTIVASYKKLTALVPVSNDMMRYADPAVDAFVRDDLVNVMALREDLAFLLGDGTSNTPVGLLTFANRWVLQNNGTAGAWLTTADSTAAVNGAVGSALAGLNGGNFVTSNESVTEATVASELQAMKNKLDSANLRSKKRVWFMNPRTENYLYGVQNSLGVYVYRDEMSRGSLFGYPFKSSTQIPTNYYDPTGSNLDCSFLFLVDVNEVMILDSMQLELAVSREGTYVDASGATQSAFQNDMTLIRAIAEHDFQMRHPSGVAIDQFVRWQ